MVKEKSTDIVLKKDSCISIADIYNVAVNQNQVVLDKAVFAFLSVGRKQLENRLAAKEIIYGVNTGFGGNADMIVPQDQLLNHQSNLLTFLSAGTGEGLSLTDIRAAQFLILISLCQGWSAVSAELVEILVAHMNANIIPFVPRYGSVGASGDLIPLSYMASALCGLGEVYYNGQWMPAAEAINAANIPTVHLKEKEGLALINGTRLMTGISALAWFRLNKTFRAAIGAITMVTEALNVSYQHLDPRIHKMKSHPGQRAIAATLHDLLAGSRQKSRLAVQKMDQGFVMGEQTLHAQSVIQEVYSIRCVPQILGVIPESLQQVQQVIEREANSVNDNPMIDPENGDVLNGGNFMGNHIARTMDALKLDIALLANHLHALVALLMDDRFSNGLPNSLSPQPGMYQGLKGIQLSQTALVAALRRETAPSSIHTLPTEQYNQDIVSMGTHAAQDVAEMERKLRDVVSMTLISAAQGLRLRNQVSDIAPKVAHFYGEIKKIVADIIQDRPLDKDVKALSQAIIEDKLPLPDIKLSY